MNDENNWVPVGSQFNYEKALSDYIASYPHHLEDGLVPHPGAKVRERVFGDRSRLDVLLLDRDSRPVVVECKQGVPTTDNLAQLRRYMKRLHDETGSEARGILVHGGSRKLRREVADAAAKLPAIEVVQHQLRVSFTGSAAG